MQNHSDSWPRLGRGVLALLACGVVGLAGPRAVAAGGAVPEPPPDSVIRILHPGPGAVFPSGKSVIIEAEAVDPNGDIRHLDFFANGESIGSSDYLAKVATIPGRPIPHRLEWKVRVEGPYELLARGIDTLGRKVESEPVLIEVMPVSGGVTVVRIDATSATTSEPIPFARIAPGQFTVRRSGDLSVAIAVGLTYGGTAEPKADYEPLPEKVEIPAGKAEASFFVQAVSDEEVEGPETVIAEIVPVFLRDGGPPAGYRIDPEHARARVEIQDEDQVGRATLVINNPKTGAVFREGATIAVRATAVDPEGYVARVEFLDGEEVLGVSELTFVRAPDPGTPIVHAFEWRGAKAGKHSLSVRSIDTAGQRVVSPPVVIEVRALPTEPARLALEQPAPGDVFELGQPVEIHAVAVDPQGYISRVEFFADEASIGVSELLFLVAPEPGSRIDHHLTWDNAPEGRHVIHAQALDAAGQGVASERVPIVVGTDFEKPVVLAVEARDARAAEPGDEAVASIDTGTFVIRRVDGPRDVAVSVYFGLGGSARNGVDYARLQEEVLLREGVDEVEVVVVPLRDELVEGEEKVVLELRPVPCPAIFPTPPWCYRIEGPGAASVVIADDADDGNRAPRVALTQPDNGAVFTAGQGIDLQAEARDDDGQIARLEIREGGTVLAATEGGSLNFEWLDAPEGLHRLTAWAMDDGGKTTTSKAVTIYVRDALARAFVRRLLPPAYLPGGEFEVRLLAVPPRGSSAWTVSEGPPSGWLVTDISDEGVFDTGAGAVKFGPFLDSRERELSYRVIPGDDAAGNQTFRGFSSVDGESFPVAGADTIGPAGTFHPADARPADHRIVADELTAYAAAWKRGAPWGEGEATIPLAYVSRAGFLWQSGEVYAFDPAAGAPPECWVALDTGEVAPAGRVASTRGIADRQGPATWKPGGAGEVAIVVTPPPGARSVTVEERVPLGWRVVQVSDDGVFDASTGRVRWGIFFGETERRLTYRLAPPAGAACTGSFSGVVSFDGAEVAILGVGEAGASDDQTALRIVAARHDRGGRSRLQIEAPEDQVFVIEASSDLERWVEVDARVYTGEEVEVNDPATDGARQRYYRLRPVGR